MDLINNTNNGVRRLTFRGLSIQQRLPLLICVLLLSVIIAGGVVSYFQVRNDSLKAGSERLHSSSEQLTALLAQSSQTLTTNLRNVASQPAVRDFVLAPQEPKDSILTALRATQDTTTVYTEVLDSYGRLIASIGNPGIEQKVGWKKLAGPGARPDTGKIGKFYAVNDTLYFPLSVPVWSENEVSGYIIRWRRVVNNSRTITQVVKLMGLEDVLVYFGNTDNTMWTDMDGVAQNPVPPKYKEERNILRYVNKQGKEVLAARQPIPLTNWMIVIEESQQQIMQPARDFLRSLIIIGVILLAVGILWAWIMSRNITRPLNQLTAAASSIAEGSSPVPVAVHRNDEVGKLAHAFNIMIGQLGKARERLEQKVQEAETANNQLRELSAHLQNVREAERIHIAREMHDELGQLLTGFKMDVSWLAKKLNEKDDPLLREKLAGMTGLVDESVKFVRKLAAELRPSILDDLGLIAALEWHSKEFEKRYNVTVDFQTQNEEIKAGSLVATGLFRMYQESLTNVARHSGATKVQSTISVQDGKIHLTIADNGRGFDTKRGERKTLGLLGMKERAIMVGGELNIRSEPGKGTTVDVKVPMEAPQSKIEGVAIS